LALLLVVVTIAGAAAVLSAVRERDRQRDREQAQVAADAAFGDAAATWRADELAPLVADVGAARFSDVVVVGRAETIAESTVQKARCDELLATRATVDGLAPPAAPDGISAAARRSSEELEALADGYREAVLAPLSEVITYCGYYIRAIALSREASTAEGALDAAVTKTGLLDRTVNANGSVTTTTCTSPDGCIPLTAAARTTYVAAYTKARVDVLGRRYANNGGGDSDCRLSDLAPVCAVYVERTAALTAGYQAFIDAVAATTELDDPGVKATGGAADALAAAFGKALDAAYATTLPKVDAGADDGYLREELVLLKGYEAALSKVPAPGL